MRALPEVCVIEKARYVGVKCSAQIGDEIRKDRTETQHSFFQFLFIAQSTFVMGN